MSFFLDAANPVYPNPDWAIPDCEENITFPPFSKRSNKLSRKIVIATNAVCQWGTGQKVSGQLDNQTDFNIVGGGWYIELVYSLWNRTIQSNSLGLLNIDIYEIGCPTEES